MGVTTLGRHVAWWWRRARLWAALKIREATDVESDLRAALAGRDDEIRHLKWELEESRNTIGFREREIEHLANVHERDRVRIKAEIAAYAKEIAKNEPRPTGQ